MKALAFVCAIALLMASCTTPAILVPQQSAPAWAVRVCGMNPVMCSDGFCCPALHACTVDRFLPIYRDPPGEGFCTFGGE